VCAIPANSATDGQCVYTEQTSQRICATNKPPANIAEPVAAITNYASDAGECTMAGTNKSADNRDIENEELEPGPDIHHRMQVCDLPCENNNHAAKDLPIHTQDTAGADRLQVCCAAFRYVAEAW